MVSSSNIGSYLCKIFPPTSNLNCLSYPSYYLWFVPTYSMQHNHSPTWNQNYQDAHSCNISWTNFSVWMTLQFSSQNQHDLLIPCIYCWPVVPWNISTRPFQYCTVAQLFWFPSMVEWIQTTLPCHPCTIQTESHWLNCKMFLIHPYDCRLSSVHHFWIPTLPICTNCNTCQYLIFGLWHNK